MSQLMGRRFIFGVVAVICVTAATITQGYNGDIYLKLIGTVTGLFLASQTLTDSQDRRKDGA